MNGSGVLIPRGEGRMITAITWFLRNAAFGSGDKALLRAYIGRLGDEAWTAMCRADIERRVPPSCAICWASPPAPLFCELAALPESMPQYPVGHVERLEALRGALCRAKPGLLLCGADMPA
ncbi:hypothetical protein [Paenibacillus macerans]|uniref:hypothetical protein n=1 Tax=Paenibacillus macerans TaxID=44252 RepID=UPI003D2922EC